MSWCRKVRPVLPERGSLALHCLWRRRLPALAAPEAQLLWIAAPSPSIPSPLGIHKACTHDGAKLNKMKFETMRCCMLLPSAIAGRSAGAHAGCLVRCGLGCGRGPVHKLALGVVLPPAPEGKRSKRRHTCEEGWQARGERWRAARQHHALVQVAWQQHKGSWPTPHARYGIPSLPALLLSQKPL